MGPGRGGEGRGREREGEWFTACLFFFCPQFASFDPVKVKSTPQVRTDLFGRKLDRVLLTDFFGSVRNIELLNQTSPETNKGRRGEERELDSEHTPATGSNERPLPQGYYLTPQDALVRM